MKKQQDKTRPIRMSDKSWNELKKHKKENGKPWDKFIVDVNSLLQVKK